MYIVTLVTERFVKYLRPEGYWTDDKDKAKHFSNFEEADEARKAYKGSGIKTIYMKTVNTITGERIRKIRFPDNQPHIVLSDIELGDQVRVVAPIRSSDELFEVLLIADAIDGLKANKSALVIPYLMGARYDRRMQPGDSFDLKIVARMINACFFRQVHLFDVHSAEATYQILASKSHTNQKLVEAYAQPNAVVIIPDKGAALKADNYQAWNPNLVDRVSCKKNRDLETGRITLEVIEPEICKDRNCVVIDDLCDGGGTFNAIAEQIQPKHLTLIVSHGIFSKGFSKLKEKFNEIITSDSFAVHAPDKVTTIKLDL